MSTESLREQCLDYCVVQQYRFCSKISAGKQVDPQRSQDTSQLFRFDHLLRNHRAGIYRLSELCFRKVKMFDRRCIR